MSNSSIYAEPRNITSPEECFFYHTIDVPGHGTFTGEWDLRSRTANYLGKFPLQGKRVLEVGTANGFLCFEMEKQGAEVVAFDLSDQFAADVVPFARFDYRKGEEDHKKGMRRLNNAFWFCHQAHQSKSKVVYGNTYAIPPEIGKVDVSLFGAILLHLRDPFLALQNAAQLTQEAIIVTEPLWKWGRLFSFFALSKIYDGSALFVPNPSLVEPKTTWWNLSPSIVKRFLGVLGFEKSVLTFHAQKHKSGTYPFFTIIAYRTVPNQYS